VRYYHVTQRKWRGDDLISLAVKYGNLKKATQAFIRRWPDAARVAEIHSRYVFLFADIDEALDHQRVFAPRGSVLEINTRGLRVSEDPHEGYAIVSDYIPASNVVGIVA
jgi:hypothetical protein